MRICSNFSVKCEASHNNKSKLFYAVRASTEQEEIAIINNAVETLSLDKKKEAVFRTFLIFIQFYILNFCINFKYVFLNSVFTSLAMLAHSQ